MSKLKIEELIGVRFGKLIVVDIIGVDKYGHKIIRCICDCGNESFPLYTNLKRGLTKSCGCTKGGHIHGLSGHPMYKTWEGMVARCENKNNSGYINYGGRGITVCTEWRNSFKSFYDWAIENGYSENLTIDRIDNDGNYCPENCQWITNAENNAVGKTRMSSRNTSGYIGVVKSRTKGKWVASIQISGKVISLGTFANIQLAIEARINAEIKYLGEQKTNFNYSKD